MMISHSIPTIAPYAHLQAGTREMQHGSRPRGFEGADKTDGGAKDLDIWDALMSTGE